MNNQSSSLNAQTTEILTRTGEMLDKLVEQVRRDIGQTKEPKAQALLETTAEVLLGLKKAYQDYGRGGEKAWD